MAAGGKTGPVADFDDLGFAELGVEFDPQVVIGQIGVPQNSIGVAQGYLFAVGKTIRGLIIV